MEESNRLGEFLRARRELVREIGPTAMRSARRRAPGLRREDVALAAGISVDYYKRLEQGQARHPSSSVIMSLARVLHLSTEGAEYLRRLVWASGNAEGTGAKAAGEVSPGLAGLLDSWDGTPAFLVDSVLNVLRCTRMAAAIHAGLAYEPNLARLLFLDQGERALYTDWDRAARECVAWLRSAVGTDRHHPEFSDVVRHISERDEDFARLWALHEVRIKSSGSKRLLHPLVGELQLGFETFTVNAAVGQSMIVYHAKPGSATARALTLLVGASAEAGDRPGAWAGGAWS